MRVNIALSARASLVAAALFISACASSPPHAKFANSSASSIVMHASDTTALTVSTGSAVVLAEHEKLRVTEQIKSHLAAKQALNPALPEPKQYAVEVTITRYEKGSAFARAMLAGLGQIHLDGLIKVFEQNSHTQLSEFTLEKTFAWGGIYGGTTSIEDIEGTFAEGLANALTGHEDDAKGGAKSAKSASAQ